MMSRWAPLCALPLAACVPRSEPQVRVDVAAPSCPPPASVAPAPAAKGPEARWQSSPVLVEGPVSMKILDAGGGLGCSYELLVELDRLDEKSYGGHGTLRVKVDDPNGGGFLPVRLGDKDLDIPAARVRAFVDLLRRAGPTAEHAIVLGELDSFRSTELFLHARTGGAPLYLHVEDPGPLAVELDRPYTVSNDRSLVKACRGLFAELELDSWVDAQCRAGIAAGAPAASSNPGASPAPPPAKKAP